MYSASTQGFMRIFCKSLQQMIASKIENHYRSFASIYACAFSDFSYHIKISLRFFLLLCITDYASFNTNLLSYCLLMLFLTLLFTDIISSLTVK